MGRGLGRLAERVFEAVIFDMDGTLIDSAPAVERSWGDLGRRARARRPESVRHHGVPAAGIVEVLIPKDQQRSAIDRINELEVADVEDIVVLPGAAEALAAVRAPRTRSPPPCTTAGQGPDPGGRAAGRRRCW